MRTLSRLPILLLLPLLVFALPGAAQGVSRESEGRDDVWEVRRNDPGMHAAMERARETLPTFNRYLEDGAGGDVVLKLKAPFRQGDEVEHMWISCVTFDGQVYRGRLESRPRDLTNVSRGDVVTLRPERISDWMVVVDDVMLGNFTTMLLRSRMKPGERAELDRMMGYRILADSAITALPRQ